jgi:uncharacterized protein (TIGR03437 family)
LYFSWQGLQLIHDETVRVVTATPGVFAVEGNAAALNQDGSRNGERNRAKAGTVVQVYATGLGAVTGTLGIGEFAPVSAAQPTTNPVAADIGGKEAEVLFAGLAPGLIGGVYQVNVKVPEEVAVGKAELRLRVAGAESPGVGVWVD